MAIGKSSARRPGATTVVTPAVQQLAGQKAAIPLIKAQPQANLTRRRIDTAAVSDPKTLARTLSSLQDDIDQASIGARTNPLNGGGTLLKSLAFTSATAKLVQHSLGRAPIGYFITRVQSVTAATSSYGALYNKNSDAVTASLVTIGTFVQLKQVNAGPSSGTTVTSGASASIKVLTAGTYAVSFQAVYTVTGGDAVTFSAFVNGAAALDLQSWNNSTGSASTSVGVGIYTPHTFAANDVVDMRATDETNNATTLTLLDSQFSVQSLAGGGGTALEVYETALPAGTDATQYLNLIPSATGTADLFVF